MRKTADRNARSAVFVQYGILQRGIAEAVDQRVETAALFAVGAVAVVIALIAGQVVYVVD